MTTTIALGDRKDVEVSTLIGRLIPLYAANFRAPGVEVREPIESVGEKVIIKPEIMAVDRPYFFEFLGVSLAAVKRADGRVDVYQIPAA